LDSAKKANVSDKDARTIATAAGKGAIEGAINASGATKPSEGARNQAYAAAISSAKAAGVPDEDAVKIATSAGEGAATAANATPASAQRECHLFPTATCWSDAINDFFSTEGPISYFNQVKSIYNGASNSATVSADLTSLNFTNGMQVTATTNIQAGPSNSATSSNSAGVPTLSGTSAGQAAQNTLYGGTVLTSVVYPILFVDTGDDAGGFTLTLNAAAREGIDIQNFKAGTSTSISSPPSHSNVGIEGYLKYNSTNLIPGSSQYAGAIFFGGSYGYSNMSHGYARDYGFGTNVSNAIGQISVGILVNGVVQIAMSRAFGPSQTYIDNTSMTQRTVNNFKALSFGISYQSKPSKEQAAQTK
jgi:hypothetical protein